MTLALPDLVAQIERAHYEAIRAASSAVDRAIACGELLIRAKAEVRQLLKRLNRTIGKPPVRTG